MSGVSELYGRILAMWPYSEAALFVTGQMVVYGIFYWVASLLLYVFCYSSWNWFSRYKIQPHKHPDRELVMKCLAHLLVSYVVVQPLIILAMYKFILRTRMEFSAAALPAFWEGAATIVFWFAMMDLWFYWTHRFLHTFPAVYGLIHKQHHAFNVTVGIAAAYAHPMEDLFVNFMSTFIGVMLYPSHFVVFLIYVALRINETVDAHSGYAFPWSIWTLWDDRARRHDFHHSQNVCNFGAWPFWDRVMGTDIAYKAARKAAITNASTKTDIGTGDASSRPKSS